MLPLPAGAGTSGVNRLAKVFSTSRGLNPRWAGVVAGSGRPSRTSHR